MFVDMFNVRSIGGKVLLFFVCLSLSGYADEEQWGVELPSTKVGSVTGNYSTTSSKEGAYAAVLYGYGVGYALVWVTSDGETAYLSGFTGSTFELLSCSDSKVTYAKRFSGYYEVYDVVRLDDNQTEVQMVRTVQGKLINSTDSKEHFSQGYFELSYLDGKLVVRQYRTHVKQSKVEVTGSGIGVDNNNLQLSFYAEDGVSYRAEYSEDLVNWYPIGDVITGTGQSVSLVTPVVGGKRFMRVTTVE